MIRSPTSVFRRTYSAIKRNAAQRSTPNVKLPKYYCHHQHSHALYFITTRCRDWERAGESGRKEWHYLFHPTLTTEHNSLGTTAQPLSLPVSLSLSLSPHSQLDAQFHPQGNGACCTPEHETDDPTTPPHPDTTTERWQTKTNGSANPTLYIPATSPLSPLSHATKGSAITANSKERAIMLRSVRVQLFVWPRSANPINSSSPVSNFGRIGSV